MRTRSRKLNKKSRDRPKGQLYDKKWYFPISVKRVAQLINTDNKFL